MNIDLVEYPDVFLRNVSKDVTFPLDDKTQGLLNLWQKPCIKI